MATRFPRLVRAPLFRLAGAILVLTTLAACVGPHPRYYGGGGGGYGRSYAGYQQPAYRGGYNQGWHHGQQRRWR